PNACAGSPTPPDDNRDGKLNPGIFEYVTVYSREPNQRADGSARIDVNNTDQSQLTSVLQESLGQQRAQEIQQQIQPYRGQIRSLVEFYLRSKMTAQEFTQVAGDLTVTNSTYLEGLINVNTAPAPVLACIPGIGMDKAPQLVAWRRSRTTNDLYSVAWVTQVLDETSAIQAGPYITTFSYQFSADVVAMGNHGRGYRRTLFVFDTSNGNPRIVYRRDRERLGWALGAERQSPWLAGKELP
ncbi:MAG: general secretion pathway protein GspK, partial [Candidatus Omnitrophica bacterium]|nr:general secretion pathway protein GspK [Candidatus Omnitrophota bacterium]